MKNKPKKHKSASSRKVVINACFGGFSLSMAAVKRMAEIQGRPCYFFTHKFGGPETYVPYVAGERAFTWSAFDIPNPNEVLRYSKPWAEMTQEERIEANRLTDKHSIKERDVERDSPLLIQVVEELGRAADGEHAKLKIVKIPANVKWVIDEYDGSETVQEQHRSWG